MNACLDRLFILPLCVLSLLQGENCAEKCLFSAGTFDISEISYCYVLAIDWYILAIGLLNTEMSYLISLKLINLFHLTSLK